jgi:acetyl-CoA carboxylase carboxyltransferase component
MQMTDQSCRFDALRKAREWISSLPPTSISRALSAPLDPRYPADDLLALVNPDIKKALDMTEVLLRIVDDSRLSIFKPSYGINMITTWATVQGM